MWTWKQPTVIHSGAGSRARISEIAESLGSRPVLVSDAVLRDLPVTGEIIGLLGEDVRTFFEVPANPTVAAVDALAALIRGEDRDVVIALGGGSSLDCAKAAASIAVQGGSAREYHSEGRKLDGRHVPLVALPTTAGTGSEVTPISVLDDTEKGIKGPIVHDNFFPDAALLDAETHVTMPPYVTACTGLDALSHAIEGYWSKNHQPICDVLAKEAVRLVFRFLPRAFEAGDDIEAREGMSLAALLGGLAFQLPKNAAVHACSFPLSSRYHLPHGAACAMTLDHFMRFNAPALGERGIALALAAGFEDMNAMADAVAALKKHFGVACCLRDAGVEAAELDGLTEASFHPLMDNNPREVTPAELRSLYADMFQE
jgi:alcohol dehydrogenase